MKVRGREEVKKRGLAAAAACEERRAVGSANPLLLHHPCSVTQLARPEFYRVGSPDPNAAADELLSILLFEGEEQDEDDNEIESAGVFLGSSPPQSRPANPMVMDPMFGEINPVEPFLLLWASGSMMGSASSSSRKEACGSKNLEIQPPASRIEGFGLSLPPRTPEARDHRHCLTRLIHI